MINPSHLCGWCWCIFHVCSVSMDNVGKQFYNFSSLDGHFLQLEYFNSLTNHCSHLLCEPLLKNCTRFALYTNRNKILGAKCDSEVEVGRHMIRKGKPTKLT